MYIYIMENPNLIVQSLNNIQESSPARESKKSKFLPSLFTPCFRTRCTTIMLLKDLSLSPCSMAKSLPYAHHSHTMLVEVLEKPTNPTNNDMQAAIELRIHQRYVLYIEPIKGYLVAADKEVVESRELCLQFKIPFFLLYPTGLPLSGDYVSGKLVELPISLDLCDYLKPYIQSSAADLARRTGFKKEFKLIFVVRSMKYDLADKQECDRIGCSLRG